VFRDHSGFAYSNEIFAIDFEHPVHPRQGKHDPPLNRHTAAHVTVTGPPGRNRDSMTIGKTEQPGNRFGIARPNNCVRPAGGKPFIPRMRLEHRGIETEFASRKDAAELSQVISGPGVGGPHSGFAPSPSEAGGAARNCSASSASDSGT